MVEQHQQALQFYCPNPSAQFLNLTNRFDSTLSNQVVNIYVSKCDVSDVTCKSDNSRRVFFDGKGILLLINSEYIDGNSASVKAAAKHSVPHWLSLSMDAAETTRIVLQRYRYRNDAQPARKMFNIEPDNLDYWSVVKDEGHWNKELYAYSRTNTSVYAQVQFSVNEDLVQILAKNESRWFIVPYFTGWAIFLYVIGRVGKKLFMPWITYLSVIIRLFKMDPSKGKMPRDPTVIDKVNPHQLVN